MSKVNIGTPTKLREEEYEKLVDELRKIPVQLIPSITNKKMIRWSNGGDRIARLILKAYLRGIKIDKIAELTNQHQQSIRNGLKTLGIEFETHWLNQRCRELVLELENLKWELNRSRK